MIKHEVSGLWPMPMSTRCFPELVLVLLQILCSIQSSKATYDSSSQVIPLSFDEGPLGLSLRPPGTEGLLSFPHTSNSVRATQTTTNAIMSLTDTSHILVMEDNSADAVFTFTAKPESSYNFSDYTVRIVCSEPQVIMPEDIARAPPVLLSDGSANFTFAISFDRSVGTTDITFELLRTDLTLYDSITAHYVICGMSFFHIDLYTGERKLVEANKFYTTTEDVAENNRLGRLLDFLVLIQFPDGSTSANVSGNFDNLPYLDQMVMSVEGAVILAENDASACKQGHYARLTEKEHLVLPEHCGYGFSPFTPTAQPHFGCRLRPFRTGSVKFHFVYADLLRGTIYDEMYETHLEIIVSGVVPPAVLGIAPPGPFRPSGGQFLICDVINVREPSEFKLQLGNETIVPTKEETSSKFVRRLTFVTPKGKGQDIPWDLLVSENKSLSFSSCPWAGIGNRYRFNYIEGDIHITEITPSSGPNNGEILAKCMGFFGNFSLSDDSSDALWFGSYRIPSDSIIGMNESYIEFEVPSHSNVHSPSPQVPCYVVVNGLRSNEVMFVYESLKSVHISIDGASFNEKRNFYEVSFCSAYGTISTNSSILLHAHPNSEAKGEHLEFDWFISYLSSKKQLVRKSGDYINGSTLYLPISILDSNEKYQALVVAKDKRFSSQVTSQVELKTTNAQRIGIGLTFEDSRTVAYPPVDVRISAVIIPNRNCISPEHSLSYEWTFSSLTKSLSYKTNSTDLSSPSPRRIGREYVVPLRTLTVGAHKIKVHVVDTINKEVYGLAIGLLQIEASPLQAIIGSGENFVQASSASDLEISGIKSYDPDSREPRPERLRFIWKCELSIEGGRTFIKALMCPDSLIDQATLRRNKFTISSSRLQSIYDSTSSAFLRFSLTVAKINLNEEFEKQTSKMAVQVIEVLFSEETLSPRGDIMLFDSEGYPVKTDRVPYFDSLIITPKAAERISWEFQLVKPEKERFSFLQNPNNLILAPGYYNPNNLGPSRHSLGINKTGLRPDTRYTFQVRYISSKGRNPQLVEISFKTMSRPSVSLIATSNTVGGINTLYSIAAIPSTKNFDFKYYFFVEINGNQLCIDGCSGHRRISFRMPLSGRFTIRCVVMDARGRHILATSKDNVIIEVNSELSIKEVINTSNAQDQFGALNRSYRHGDHGSFILECYSLFSHLQATPISSRKEEEIVGDIISTTLEQLATLYYKTKSNSPLARDYVKVSQIASSLPLRYSASPEESFYNLCRMIREAMVQIGTNEKLEVMGELNATLIQLREHARQIGSEGSTHKNKNKVNAVLLDINELVVPLWAEATRREAECGISRNDQSVGGLVDVVTSSSCMAGQQRKSEGKHTILKWCEHEQSRIIGVIGEFKTNYLVESGVIANTSTWDNTEGFISDETRLSYSWIRENVENGDVEEKYGCVQLEQYVDDSYRLVNGEEIICQDGYGIEYERRKVLGEKLDEKSYTTSRLKDSKEKEGKIVSVIGGEGLHDVRREGCVQYESRIVGVGATWWMPVAFVTLCTLLVVIGVVTWLRSIGVEYSTVEGGDIAYIERDVYGRDVGIADEMAIDSDSNDNEDDDEEIVFQAHNAVSK